MKYLVHIFMFFCFFPYIDILNIGTDTQPNALLVGALILFGVRDKKINAPIILLWCLFLSSLLLIFMNNLDLFTYLKNCLNYLSPALVSTAAYVAFSQLDYKFSFKAFMWTIIIYAFVAMMQLFVIPDFLTFLLNEGRGTLIGGRGVVSLCPEPAFYGSTCLFFMIYSLMAYTKKQNYLAIPFLLAQMFFLSRSTTAIAVLAFALLVFSVVQILRFRVTYTVCTILVLLIAIPYANRQLEKLEETRLGIVTKKFIDDPLMIAKVDKSVGVRFAGAVAPFLNMRYNYFMPMGIGNLENFFQGLYRQGECRSFLSKFIVHDDERLGGSMNTALFQLGFLGLLFPIAIFLAFKQQLGSSAGWFCFVLFVTLLFTQLQLMHSMIGLIIGYAIHHSKQQRLKTGAHLS